MNLVITGTSRGIGLELVSGAVARGDRVLAIARNVANLAHFGDRVQSLAIDVTAPDLVPRLTEALREWSHVDVLMNVAGVYQQHAEIEDFEKSFRVNSIAPFVITRAVLPWLKKSKSPRAVQVTSKMGSIADNSGGGVYAYRASKAALNMINRSLSVDQDWLTTIVMHPGWVQTDMGGTNAPTSVKESADGIWSVTERLKPADSGEFFDFRGEPLPW